MSQPTAPAESMSRVSIGPEGLRQLAHPIRLRVWESLVRSGPATATTLAERLDESSGLTSYHLRRLASLGLIREAVGPSRGRNRWWEAIPGGYRVEVPEGDRAGQAASEAIIAQSAEASLERYLQFRDNASHARDEESKAWAHAATSDVAVLRLTLDDLNDLAHEFETLLASWYSRAVTGPQSKDTRIVEVLLRAFPVESRE